MVSTTNLREQIARIIDPQAWRAFDATLQPYIENRGTREGEHFWHVQAYRTGCTTAEEATEWWYKNADETLEPSEVWRFRLSLTTADKIMDLITVDVI